MSQVRQGHRPAVCGQDAVPSGTIVSAAGQPVATVLPAAGAGAGRRSRLLLPPAAGSHGSGRPRARPAGGTGGSLRHNPCTGGGRCNAGRPAGLPGADARRAQAGVAPGQLFRHLVTGDVRLVAVAVGQGESGAQAGQVPPFLFQFALQGMLGAVHGQDLRERYRSRQDTPAHAPGHGKAMTVGVRSCEKRAPRRAGPLAFCAGEVCRISGGSC